MIPSDAAISLSTESRFIGAEWGAVHKQMSVVAGGEKIGEFVEEVIFMPASSVTLLQSCDGFTFGECVKVESVLNELSGNSEFTK